MYVRFKYLNKKKHAYLYIYLLTESLISSKRVKDSRF